MNVPAAPAPRAAGHGLTAGLRRFAGWIAAALKWSLVLAAAVMLGCITLQVVMRYVFGRSPSWTEELAILMFAWITLGGLPLGVREGFHVSLSMVLQPLPRHVRIWAERAIAVLTAVLGLYLLWSGLRFVEFTEGSTSAAIGYPIELLHGLAPVSGFLIALFALERIIAPPESLGPEETAQPL